MNRNMNITRHHIMAIRRLNSKLEEFVKQGFRDEINFQNINADRMFGLVAEQALCNLERAALFEPSTTQKGTKGQNSASEQDLLEFAYELYAKHVSSISVSVVAQQPPVDVGLIKQERIDAIVEANSLKFKKLVPLGEDGDPVIRAWNMARANRQLALQRVGAFFYLSSQKPGVLYGDQRDRVDKEDTAAVQFLFNRASDFQASELKFAVLLGGDALAQTKARIVQESFGSNMGIIQYLCPDEQSPGRYSIEQADEFRNKINEYAGMK